MIVNVFRLYLARKLSDREITGETRRHAPDFDGWSAGELSDNHFQKVERLSHQEE